VATLTRLGPFEADLRAAGIPTTCLNKRLKVDPMALQRLVAHLRRGRYDVVQTWIFAANVYGRIAARRARVPVVLTSEMAVDLWKGAGHRAIDRRLARWCDAVVGNSQAVLDYYRDLVGIEPAKLRLIYSGIGPEETPPAEAAAARAELGLAPGARLMVYAGRLARQKCVDDLIDALDLLQHIRPDTVTLLIGDGPERTRLEERAAAFRMLGRNVRFLGHRQDAARWIAAADIVVLSSRYEGLPNVVLEAMRCARPVVATAAPGTTELVVPGETGLLVPVGDHKALAAALRDLIDDPGRASRLGQACRDRVDRQFRADAMIEQFGELYETIARQKGLRV
jgi:glycosyltransferase involved in cell wall biosynthesis